MRTAPPETAERPEPLLLRVIDRISGIAAIGAAFALWALLVNVVVDVLARTFSGRPLGLTLELTTYWWMPLIVGLAYAITERANDHITVTLLLDRLAPKLRRMVFGCFSAIGALLVAALAWYTLQTALEAAEVRLIANSNPPLEYWQIHFLTFLGLALLAVQLLARAIREFSGHLDAVESDDPMLELLT
jgi:TRAP-type C4-dicarboxylate transport system permease small subunit